MATPVQSNLDRYWEALSAGGTVEQCGWVKDRWGVSWQIVPALLGALVKDPDRPRAARVAQAMLDMKKLDIAGLKRAHEG